ncbi:MAG: WxL protein peptidoglycan domain-containing protein, partial [Enterococcus hulanensis]
MKQKTVTSVLSLIFICFLSVIAAPYAHAEETSDSAQNDVGYHIYAVLPENQIGGKDSFFNLRMTPGQKQTVEFVVANT